MPNLLDYVGNTPLIEITHPYSKDVHLHAKLEWFNPTGSVKDRAAKAIIEDGLKTKKLVNKILIDATSGNTGIAYAAFCSNLMIPLELALPSNASPERQAILKQFGVKLHLTSPMDGGTDGAQRYVQKLIAEQPDRYYYPDQYSNENNWKAHFTGTGPEIWRQTEQTITHFVAGLGTSGTFVGTTRYLQPKGVQCISVQPDAPLHGLEGWKHMETAIVPGIYQDDLADEAMIVGTEDAFKYARAATKFLGLHVSPSAAANLFAAMSIVKGLDKGTVVTVFPDNAMKYLQEPFWTDDRYLIENPF